MHLQHLQGRWLRLGSGGQGSAGLEEGALGPAQAQVAAWRCLRERCQPGLQLEGDDDRWAQVDAGEIVGPGLLVRPAAVVGPVLDQDQALLAQGGEVLLHGTLVAGSKARDRGIAGGEHRRAAQAPAAVEGQERTQRADHAGAQAELTSAFLEHPPCGCGVRQGWGEVPGRLRHAPVRSPLRRCVGPRPRLAELARPAVDRPRDEVACSRSRPKACSCRREMCDENHRSCLRYAPARPIETGRKLSILSHIARACRLHRQARGISGGCANGCC